MGIIVNLIFWMCLILCIINIIVANFFLYINISLLFNKILILKKYIMTNQTNIRKHVHNFYLAHQSKSNEYHWWKHHWWGIYLLAWFSIRALWPKVIGLLEIKKVNIVTKEDNPPNVPEGRPIENLWGILIQKVYKNGCVAKSLLQLKRRIKYCLSKLAQDLVQKLARSTMKRLRFIWTKGLIEDWRNSIL